MTCIPFGTGIIFGKEYLSVRDVVKKINPGDTVAAKVVDLKNPEGYIELSLKEAKQALVWTEAEKAMKDKRTFEVIPTEANKGGLIITWQGVVGFLPASQLKSDHYPRVMDGDKDRILDELKKLVGQKLSVCIISALQKKINLFSLRKIQNQKTEKKLLTNMLSAMQSKQKLQEL